MKFRGITPCCLLEKNSSLSYGHLNIASPTWAAKPLRSMCSVPPSLAPSRKRPSASSHSETQVPRSREVCEEMRGHMRQGRRRLSWGRPIQRQEVRTPPGSIEVEVSACREVSWVSCIVYLYQAVSMTAPLQYNLRIGRRSSGARLVFGKVAKSATSIQFCNTYAMLPYISSLKSYKCFCPRRPLVVFKEEFRSRNYW